MRTYKVEIEISLHDDSKTDWIANSISEQLEDGEQFTIDIKEIKEPLTEDAKHVISFMKDHFQFIHIGG